MTTDKKVEVWKGGRTIWCLYDKIEQALNEGWVLAAEKRCLQLIELVDTLRRQANRDKMSTSFTKKSVGLLKAAEKRKMANVIDEAMKL